MALRYTALSTIAWLTLTSALHQPVARDHGFVASPAVQTIRPYTALPPSDDAFYQPTPGYETEAPGTILRARSLPPPSGINATISAYYQLLYRSTDSNNQPNAVVTSLLIPANASFDKFISYQIPYDSPATDCAPSYSFSDPSTIIGGTEIFSVALSAGLPVSIPDYEGFTAAFANGIQSGQALLDSIRAVLNSGYTTGISRNSSVALIGGSGGALASEWALELQHSYAPDTKPSIVAALLTALTPNITSVFQTIDGTLLAGLTPLFLVGLSKQSLPLATWLSENLSPNPTRTAEFLQAGELCSADFALTFVNQTIAPYFRDHNSSIISEPIPHALIEEVGVMGLHGVPSVPIFLYKGTADELSPVADTDALVEKYCKNGTHATIVYQRAVGASHGDSGTYGAVAGYPWLLERLAGVPAAKGCTVSNVKIPTTTAS
ncbi:Uu.00g119960.m01.CDS01 [Anthostomella pinea]|uniref:Uu.00g119960.m01.CDS01 n=1 Tax=Anthostomella pinea TaxID=933095 RepID=A0AAI8VGR5_9PEZI|nr:Uu.00g119960.m01.CDS01 [Anthostomella pinea]